MNIRDFKLLLYSEGATSIIKVLSKYGYHSFQGNDNSDYITFGFPRGDNQSSTTLYLGEDLKAKAYTRTGVTDIIDLLVYNKMQSIPVMIQNCLSILQFEGGDEADMSWIKDLKTDRTHHVEEEELLPELDESVLDAYDKMGNWKFANDGISQDIMEEFEIGMYSCNGVITIPIRDEANRLVGVKGRSLIVINGKKYSYLHRMKKSQVLYGLNKSRSYILKSDKVFVGESEKFVMQLFSNKMKNCVSSSGHDLSVPQIMKLERLGVEVIICFDKDIGTNESGGFDKSKSGFWYKLLSKFSNGTRVSIMFDANGLLKAKESPGDNVEAMKKLYKTRLKFKGLRDDE